MVTKNLVRSLLTLIFTGVSTLFGQPNPNQENIIYDPSTGITHTLSHFWDPGMTVRGPFSLPPSNNGPWYTNPYAGPQTFYQRPEDCYISGPAGNAFTAPVWINGTAHYSHWMSQVPRGAFFEQHGTAANQTCNYFQGSFIDVPVGQISETRQALSALNIPQNAVSVQVKAQAADTLRIVLYYPRWVLTNPGGSDITLSADVLVSPAATSTPGGNQECLLETPSCDFSRMANVYLTATQREWIVRAIHADNSIKSKPGFFMPFFAFQIGKRIVTNTHGHKTGLAVAYSISAQ